MGAEYGLLGADQFIPVAEESALVNELDSHVLRLACEQVATWKRTLGAIRIHVNVSARQLCAAGFPALVEAAIDEFGLSASDLVLELTETSAMTAAEAPGATLRRLRESGVALAIDDFGAGFSSLARLATLPVNVLKVDGQFVAAVGDGSSEKATAVLDAVLTLGRSLGLLTVVEGVEHAHSLETVRRLGADCAQGFLIRHPAPAADLEGWFASEGLAP